MHQRILIDAVVLVIYSILLDKSKPFCVWQLTYILIPRSRIAAISVFRTPDYDIHMTYTMHMNEWMNERNQLSSRVSIERVSNNREEKFPSPSFFFFGRTFLIIWDACLCFYLFSITCSHAPVHQRRLIGFSVNYSTTVCHTGLSAVALIGPPCAGAAPVSVDRGSISLTAPDVL